jgi:hypothetical protein
MVEAATNGHGVAYDLEGAAHRLWESGKLVDERLSYVWKLVP